MYFKVEMSGASALTNKSVRKLLVHLLDSPRGWVEGNKSVSLCKSQPSVSTHGWLKSEAEKVTCKDCRRIYALNEDRNPDTDEPLTAFERRQLTKPRTRDEKLSRRQMNLLRRAADEGRICVDDPEDKKSVQSLITKKLVVCTYYIEITPTGQYRLNAQEKANS